MSICNHQKDQSIIISASNDQTIRFWNVDTFFSILTYKLQFIFSDMSIVNELYFYGHYDKNVRKNKIKNMLKEQLENIDDFVL